MSDSPFCATGSNPPSICKSLANHVAQQCAMDFLLSFFRGNIMFPEAYRANYSINESKMFEYDEAVIKFIRSMQEWNAYNPGSFRSRYVGTMVADLHRTLLEGGIFLYPGTKENKDGKLRLLYECNPFAFIFHVAGGRATNGCRDILDITPQKIHQRTPLFIGNKQMMTNLMRSVSKIYSFHSK